MNNERKLYVYRYTIEPTGEVIYIGKGSKMVRCIETGEIFLTMSDAAKKYGLKYPSSIWHAMESPTRVAAGLHWEFYSDDSRLVQ